MASPLPTSVDKHSRPLKRRALSPTSTQAAHLSALFANPSASAPKPPRDTASAAPPEIVANVQGSSAGAGSGEFHVYKASRRREYDRLAAMEEETRKEVEDAAFEAGREERRRRDEGRTGKNRARREKAKARKMGEKGGGPGKMVGVVVERTGVENGQAEGKGQAEENVPVAKEEGIVFAEEEGW